MVLSSGLVGASLFLFSVTDTKLKSVALYAVDYFFESMLNAVLYGWTPGAYPAHIRGTASGIASCWGRMAGIVSPLVAQHLYAQDGRTSHEGNINGVLY